MIRLIMVAFCERIARRIYQTQVSGHSGNVKNLKMLKVESRQKMGSQVKHREDGWMDLCKLSEN